MIGNLSGSYGMRSRARAPIAAGPTQPEELAVEPTGGHATEVFSPSARPTMGDAAADGPPRVERPIEPEVYSDDGELLHAPSHAKMAADEIVQALAEKSIQVQLVPGVPRLLQGYVATSLHLVTLLFPPVAESAVRLNALSILERHPQVRAHYASAPGRPSMLVLGSTPADRVATRPRPFGRQRFGGPGQWGFRHTLGNRPKTRHQEPFRPELGGLAGSTGSSLMPLGAGVAESAAQTASGEGTDEYVSTLQQWAPVLQTAVEAASDPYRRVAILQERLVTLERMGISKSGALYRRTQAELSAAQRKLTLQEESLESTREWRGLGKGAIGVGIFAGLSLTALLVILAARVRRS